MKMQLQQYFSIIFIFTVNTIFPLVYAANATVDIDYAKQGACNSTILARVGDYCDYVVTITVAYYGSSASTDLSVEIIMPDNDTMVMQMSKPSISYVGGNFQNSQTLYDPTITMSTQLNNSQYNNARIDFGTVVNNGLIAPSNTTQSSIIIGFRSVVMSNPSYQTNGSEYWVTVGVEYNNVSSIWIGQALFVYSNSTSATTGPFALGDATNSSLQIPQGSPFALAVPIVFNKTYANNMIFTIINNNPSKLGLCSAYVQSATEGFVHLPTLGYEISQSLTTTSVSNQITISLGQIINTQSYTGPSATLYVVVYGRVFITDGISSFLAGSMTAQVTSSSPTVSQTYNIYATASVSASALNGSLPTFSVEQLSSSVGIYQTLKLRVTMTVPSGFSAPVVFDLNGSSNTSMPVLQACAVKFQSAGENVGTSNPQCTDPNADLYTYSSSVNSTSYDQLTYNYGVIANLGSRSTIYADDVNQIVFDTIFQLLNTTQSVVWPTISITLGNNTIWLANAAVNVVDISYNSTNATRPDFALSYETNSTTNQSNTNLGYSRLFYYDIYTKPTGIYTPMTVRITTNETYPGSKIPVATICQVKIVDVGANLPCFHSIFYNQDQSQLITYSSRYNQRKNDTAYVQLGPLCNYETTQTDSNLGRIRIGVYVRIEPALGNGGSTYVNVDVYYSPSTLWIGQILFTGTQPGSTPSVVGTPLFFSFNSTQTFDRNVLTVVNYGLKIPSNSYGTYTSLTSAISNDVNSQTSVCRVDISPNRGRNVPCSNDISSILTYNSNGLPATAVTDLGTICSISSDNSSLNSSLSFDSNTVIVQVFVLATAQSGSSFDLTLSNLIPSGQSALASITSHLTAGSTQSYGNISSLSPLNATSYQQSNDTNNNTNAYLGQDLLIRTQFVLANNLTSEACYSLIFQFSITAATNDAAYFTNGFFISSGDNLMCMKSQALPILSSGGSTLYNSFMELDFGVACYYPIDPTNVTASTLIVQSNVRVPVTTTVPVDSQLSVDIVALINNNQTNLSSTIPFTVKSQSSYTGFTLFSNDTTNVIVSVANATIQSAIRQTVTYTYKIYLPTYSQGRLQITLYSAQNASSVTVNILSATILSAGINVGSFMTEYLLGNTYQWAYSSSVLGSTYQDTAYLDLGVVTNTGTSAMLNNFSNLTDNFITIQATGYLTDSPAAEDNTGFDVILKVTYGGVNMSNSIQDIVSRNGTEQPIMYVNRTDLTSGPYAIGSTYKCTISFGHQQNSNAECIDAQLIIYLPTWISLASYNSSISSLNYSTDSTSYALFDFGTLLFNDAGTIEFTLNIDTSNQMALVFQRHNSPMITIPYEFLCMKRPRANVAYFPTSKVFTFDDIVSLPVSMTTVSSYSSLLGSLDSCQFVSSVYGSDASLVRTTGWQTGYRSNKWMLSGATYLQINFGNLTLVKSINIEVPASFAPISTIQLGYSLDGSSFAMDPVKYLLNGSSTYSISLSKSILIRYLRVYLIDVVQPSDLLTKTSGFILNITGQTNSSDISVSSICPVATSPLFPRTILVAPPTQVGLTYYDDVYVCDEVPTRISILCHVLLNGDTTTSATWIALNTSVANIDWFVFDPSEQLQFLYGYAQDGTSIMRSDDRGLTWSVVDANEYSTVTTQCTSGVKTCRTSESYSLMSGAPGSQSLLSGAVQWTAAIDGLWTQSSGGSLAFDWFGY